MMDGLDKTWIVALDKAKARIFEWLPEQPQFQEIIVLTSDDARKREHDLKADRAGSGKGFNSNVNYTMEDKDSYQDQASHEFLKSVADLLGEKDIFDQYDSLIFIAAKDTYNTVDGSLSPKIREKVTSHVAKNLANMPTDKLFAYYTKNLGPGPH